MPTYTFHCNKCDESFELKLSFSEYDSLGKKKNPKCVLCGKKQNVKRVFDDAPDAHVKSIKTLGQLGEANARKMGKTKVQEELGKKEKKEKRKAPWYGSLGIENAKKMFSGTMQEQQKKITKYVKTGKV